MTDRSPEQPQVQIIVREHGGFKHEIRIPTGYAPVMLSDIMASVIGLCGAAKVDLVRDIPFPPQDDAA